MTLLGVIVFATVAVATYGLVAQYLGFRQVLVIDIDAYPGFLTGTFVGRNAAAAYFVIGIAATTSLIATRLDGFLRSRVMQERNWFLDLAELVRWSWMFLFADLILVAALLNTGSRGGLISCAIALATIAFVSVRRAHASRRGIAALLTVVLGTLFAMAAVSSDLLLGRLQPGLGSGGRLDVYRDTVDMILARPWLGQGAGTFADAYPLFHLRAASSGVWTRALDSYLQAAAELGLPAFGVLMLAILVVVITLLRNVGRQGEVQPTAIAALAVLAALAFQSIVDYSIQIQAVGLTVAVLVGAGIGETLACKARSLTTTYGSGKSEKTEDPHRLTTVDVTIPIHPTPSRFAAAEKHRRSLDRNDALVAARNTWTLIAPEIDFVASNLPSHNVHSISRLFCLERND